MKKSVKIIFTLSIILNLLLLGLIGGHAMRVRGEPRPWDEMKTALAPETLGVLKTTFKDKRKDIFPLFKEARNIKQQMKSIITAESFDLAAFDAQAKALQDLNVQFSEHRLEALRDILSQLPQAERAKLADHTVDKLFGRPEYGRHKKGKHGKGHGVKKPDTDQQAAEREETPE